MLNAVEVGDRRLLGDTGAKERHCGRGAGAEAPLPTGEFLCEEKLSLLHLLQTDHGKDHGASRQGTRERKLAELEPPRRQAGGGSWERGQDVPFE